MWERAVITPSGGPLLNLLTDSSNLFSISGSACSISKEKEEGVCGWGGVSSTPPGLDVRTNLRGVILHALWQEAEGRWTMNLLDELICGPVMALLTTLVILLTSLCCDSLVFPPRLSLLHNHSILSFIIFTPCPSPLPLLKGNSSVLSPFTLSKYIFW